MENYIISVRRAINDSNFYTALFTILNFPDICASLDAQDGKSSRTRYAKWYEDYIDQTYLHHISGIDCYVLRCALLHQGVDDVSDNEKRDVLEKISFREKGSHLLSIRDSKLNGKLIPNFILINVAKFAEDMCRAVEKWQKTNNNNQKTKKLFKISNDPINYGGVLMN